MTLQITRVRYQTKDGILESQPMLASGGLVVRALVRPEQQSFDIVNGHGAILISGKGKSQVLLQRNVKSKLKELGVVFGEEKRKKSETGEEQPA